MTVLALPFLGACESETGEAEMEEVPEVAEIEPEVGGEEVDLEEAYPLTEEDLGDILLVNGTVIGQPVEDGFFVRTEYDRVIFVQSSADIEPGEIVSVAGVLEAAGTVGYDQWQAGAGLSDDLAADLDLLTVYYLDDDAAPDPDA
ncbi:MAG: hypothetical protein R3223_11145 [Longimicrobiales bacterium]|nr:hypothetical protein [Longimicrobiales bacterium]